MKQITVLFLVIMLTSCGVNDKKKDVDINKKWELISLNDQVIITEKPIYIEFTNEGSLSGYSGCNQFHGNYTAKNNHKISFENIGLTRMMCPDDQMKMETEIMKLLEEVDSYSIDDGKLTLKSEDNSEKGLFKLSSDR